MKVKRPLVIAGAIAAVLLLVVLCLPLFINANQFKPTLETKLTAALGRKVTIGDIKLAIFSGGVSVSDVSIADDSNFSKSPFLTAKSLSVGVELIPLIFSKQINVRSINIESPEVNLIHGAVGKWNYSTLGSGGPSASSGTSGGGPGALSVQEIAITNGKIIVSTAGSSQRPSIYEDVKLEASDLSYTSQFPFKLSAKGPGNAALKIEGQAGPINPTDSSLTPFSATIDVGHLDLSTTGFIEPSLGIAGVMDFKADLKSDGKQISSKGNIKASKLKASAAGNPSTVPVDVEYATVYTLETRAGVLNQCDVKVGKAIQRITGSYNTAAEPAKINIKVNAPGMPLDDLEGFLPAVGVVLPSGSKLKGGTLSVNLTIVGPADKPTIAGPVDISNTKLAGFSMASKLGALGSFAGLSGAGGGNDTEIQTLRATVRNDASGTKIDSLNLVIPSIGTVTGNGTVSATGQLDFKMVAKLAGGLAKGMQGVATVAGGAAGGIGGAVSSFGGAGGLTGSKSSGGGIPFAIRGTTSNPQVIPDVGGMVGNAAKGVVPGAQGNPAGAATKTLGGLFGRKKP
jgi:AsmA protein